MRGKMTDKNKIMYIDYQGNLLPKHDGSCLLVNENDGYQFFGLDGKGFLHDGTAVELPDGNKQFFLGDGKAIIHDGSPIELPDGTMQYFDHNGRPMWPVDEKKLIPLINQQRDAFFNAMIERINKDTPLLPSELEDLRLALLAAEHPDSKENTNLVWSKNIHKTKVEPINEETSSYLVNLEILWYQVWVRYQLRHKETLSARFVLNNEKRQNCSLAELRISESMLIDELRYEFMRAERVVAPIYDLNELERVGINKHGIFLLDERLSKFIIRLGNGEGSRMFENFLNQTYMSSSFNIKSRTSAWRNPLYMHRCIANVIWFNLVKDRAQALYKKPPALPVIVNDNIHAMMRKGVKYNKETGKLISYNGQEIAHVDTALKPMPSIDMVTMQKILRPENIKVLSSVNAHRLLRWEINTVTNQAITDKIDARHIHIEGGYQELAKKIGAGTGGKAANQIRDILLWQAAPQQFVFTDPETGHQEIIKEGNMLSFKYTSSGFKSKSSLEIIVGIMLMPHYLYKLIHTASLSLSHEGLKLIPIFPEPQLVGRPADQGPQLSFQMETAVEFRKGAREFAKNNCLRITKERFEVLSSRAGLSKKLLPRVIDAWLIGGDDAPPFLKQIEKDYYAFADHIKRQQDFIIDGGKKELIMSKAARKNIAKRNAGIFFSSNKQLKKK
jgi:hypothetical protein